MIWILYYFAISSVLGAFFILARWYKEIPQEDRSYLILIGFISGWIVSPIVIITYVFKYFLSVCEYIVLKITDHINIG